MIRLEFSTAVALYLSFSVIIILILWIAFEYRKEGKKFTSGGRFIWHCSICDNTYVDSKHENISQCPRCGSYVERSPDLRSERSERT